MKRFPLLAALAIAALARPALAGIAPVYVVIFTHVEDSTPGGLLGSAMSRQNYLTIRSNLIAMAGLCESHGLPWTLQPDWKLLEAALLYDSGSMQDTTNHKNFLRYLKEGRGVTIDPHSHESGGYNYTDVAHLLDSLGVGGTTVIGGHIWDPSLPQFSAWDRFRVPVAGRHYPGALWRGDILIGSGTPNHVHDPLVSGVWRPRDRDHYFEHDPSANITAIGSYKSSVATIAELIQLHRSGAVPSFAMLTFSRNIGPSTLSAPGGFAAVADTVLEPIAAWRDSGLVVPTNFTALIGTWETEYASFGYLYDAEATVRVPSPAGSTRGVALELAGPNPTSASTVLRYTLDRAARVRLAVFDVSGREVARLADGPRGPGEHFERWDASSAPAGAYLCRLDAFGVDGPASSSITRKLIVMR